MKPEVFRRVANGIIHPLMQNRQNVRTDLPGINGLTEQRDHNLMLRDLPGLVHAWESVC